jgi:hypothetical protein
MTSSEQSTATPASPSSPSPEGVRVPPLRVRPPATDSSPSQLAGQTLSTSGPGAGSASGSGPVDPLVTGSTPFSEPPATAVRFDTKSLKEIARGAVLTATRFVHDALARTEPEQAQDVWIARDQDQAQIGDPLASIAGRHGASATNPDIVSLIEAGIGVLAYAVYHGTKAWQIRRGLRKLAALSPQATNHDTGEPA